MKWKLDSVMMFVSIFIFLSILHSVQYLPCINGLRLFRNNLSNKYGWITCCAHIFDEDAQTIVCWISQIFMLYRWMALCTNFALRVYAVRPLNVSIQMQCKSNESSLRKKVIHPNHDLTFVRNLVHDKQKMIFVSIWLRWNDKWHFFVLIHNNLS